MSLFAAGIALTPDGSGAFVAVEKIPRKLEGQDVWVGGVREPTYQCAFRIVGAEQLAGTLPEMAAHVCARLKSEPMLDDTQTRIDVTGLGRAVVTVFRPHRVYPMPIVVGGEKDTTDLQGTRTLTLPTLQATATLMFHENRIEVADGLIEGPSLLHALEKLDALPPSGPARDLGIAAAIALHGAVTSDGGQWPSKKPRPAAILDAEWSREMQREAVRQAKKARREW